MQTYIGPKHVETVKALRRFWREQGCGPTVRELADILGHAASTTYERLVRLERAGLVTRAPNLPRSWAPKK